MTIAILSQSWWHTTTIVLATEREPEGQAKRSKAADAGYFNDDERLESR